MHKSGLGGSSLRELATLRNAKRKRISSYDRTGGNDDRIYIKPGETTSIAQIDGRGLHHAHLDDDGVRRKGVPSQSRPPNVLGWGERAQRRGADRRFLWHGPRDSTKTSPRCPCR